MIEYGREKHVIEYGREKHGIKNREERNTKHGFDREERKTGLRIWKRGTRDTESNRKEKNTGLHNCNLNICYTYVNSRNMS